MDKALNQTLGSLPDDTKVYVQFFEPEYSGGSNVLMFHSLATNTREAMSSSAPK
jgi:hypothetical protein